MSGYFGPPRFRCLVCRRPTLVLAHMAGAGLVCDSCLAATEPGPDWEPKTEWGRERKAERQKLGVR